MSFNSTILAAGAAGAAGGAGPGSLFYGIQGRIMEQVIMNLFMVQQLIRQIGYIFYVKTLQVAFIQDV